MELLLTEIDWRNRFLADSLTIQQFWIETVANGFE
jgi:hypothetical protein